VHAHAGAFAVWIDLEGAFKVRQAGARICYGCQEQPGVFALRRQGGSMLCPTARFAALAQLQGLTSVLEGDADCILGGIWCHMPGIIRSWLQITGLVS
jgi:hypothetical protein